MTFIRSIYILYRTQTCTTPSSISAVLWAIQNTNEGHDHTNGGHAYKDAITMSYYSRTSPFHSSSAKTDGAFGVLIRDYARACSIKGCTLTTSACSIC